MKHSFKKVLALTCAISTAIISTSVFANATSAPDIVDEDIKLESAIAPRYVDPTTVKVNNGETVEFINNATGSPFLFRTGQTIFTSGSALVASGSKLDVELGIKNDKNEVVDYEFFNGNTYHYVDYYGEHYGISTQFKIPQTGKYKFYITNYAPDPVEIRDFGVR